MYKSLKGEVPSLPLSNGNYSVTVKATSMAGDGRSTPVQYIMIDVSNSLVLTEEVYNQIGDFEYRRRFNMSKPRVKFNV